MPALESLPRKIGPYRVLAKIGEGGMGVVYLARDSEHRQVAVKVLGSAVSADPNARRRLSREVETMRRIRSRHVAEVLDADVSCPSPYIVTRYVPGRTLEATVREDGPLRGPALGRLATGLAEALAAIHAAGVVHRDLKPGNVMLDQGQPVVIDFGIAHVPDATRLTKTGLVMGTPGYLAPDVIEGKPSSGASDVHSWGATVAFAATGRQPYGTGDYQTIFFRVLQGGADLAGIPAWLEPLVRAALAVDPRSRPTAQWLAARCSAPQPDAPPQPSLHSTRLDGTRLDGTRLDGTRLDGTRLLRPNYPSPAEAAADVAELLPPVVQPRSTVARAPSPPAQPPPPAAGHTIVGMAVMLGAAALAVLLPVAGAALAFAAISLLRAADLAQAEFAARRRLRGARWTDVLIVVVTAPWAAARAVATTVALTPLALGVAACTWAASIVIGRAGTPPVALGWAAAGAVAWYCAGPGSRAPRRQFRRTTTALIRTRGAMVAACVSTLALALAVLSAAVSQPPLTWPLPVSAVPHALWSVQGWLLRGTVGILHLP